MANVLHRITKQYIKSVNTPDYPELEWIINPVLPECNSKFWVIEGNIVREMTQNEMDELSYSTESTVYFIVEKQLLTNVNGNDHELDINAIINPVMPSCDIKYTKVVDSVIVEVTKEEKNIIDLPDKLRKNKEDIITEIRLVYTIEDEIDILRRLAFGSLNTSTQESNDYINVVNAANAKYPKPE